MQAINNIVFDRANIQLGQVLKVPKETTKDKVTFEQLDSANLGDKVYILTRCAFVNNI